MRLIRKILNKSKIRNIFLKLNQYVPWKIKEHFKMIKFYKFILYLNLYAPWNLKDYLKIKAFYSNFICTGDLCFDIGANMGKYTMYFLQAGAKVICIEPQKTCLKRLNELYGKNKKVIIVKKAVDSKEGTAKLSICDNNFALSTLSSKWKNEGRYSKIYTWNKTQKVEKTTLDSLIQLYGIPKFCKIDVEGFEVNVLKGLTKKIPYLCFEFTREFFDDAKKCVNRLLSLGPVEFNYSLETEFKLALSQWVSSDILFENLNSISDKMLCGDIYAKFN